MRRALRLLNWVLGMPLRPGSRRCHKPDTLHYHRLSVRHTGALSRPRPSPGGTVMGQTPGAVAGLGLGNRCTIPEGCLATTSPHNPGRSWPRPHCLLSFLILPHFLLYKQTMSSRILTQWRCPAPKSHYENQWELFTCLLWPVGRELFRASHLHFLLPGLTVTSMLKVGLWEHEREAGGLCLGSHVSRPHAWRASICSWWVPPHQTAWCAKRGDPDSGKAVRVCGWLWTWGKSLIKSGRKRIIYGMGELIREAQSQSSGTCAEDSVVCRWLLSHRRYHSHGIILSSVVCRWLLSHGRRHSHAYVSAPHEVGHFTMGTCGPEN